MQVIYKNEYDKQNFDKERYKASLERYGEIDSTEFEKVVKEKLEPFSIRHVSCLVREAIPVFKNEGDARKYYEEHKEGEESFERLRRITGLCCN